MSEFQSLLRTVFTRTTLFISTGTTLFVFTGATLFTHTTLFTRMMNSNDDRRSDASKEDDLTTDPPESAAPDPAMPSTNSTSQLSDSASSRHLMEILGLGALDGNPVDSEADTVSVHFHTFLTSSDCANIDLAHTRA
jgi:hypothetical protein